MIHATAHIASGAKLGINVSVGPFTVIHKNVTIGDDTSIGSHCEIGHPTKLADGRQLVIGARGLIRSHSVFYEGSTIGDDLMTGHHVVVREHTEAGSHLQIGTQGDIQGSCQLGEYVRAHSGVFIAPKSKIGNYVWLFPRVVLTNDPHPPSNITIGANIADYVAIAAGSVILPGVQIGEHSLVAAQSCVGTDVQPHTVVGGVPAKYLFRTEEILLRDGSGRSAYPWPRHFSRGYTDEFKKMWQDDLTDVTD